MRFHVVGLAHTQTTHAYSNCAFTELTRKMCDMMSSLGHDVTLYASEDNDAVVDELVTCITRGEQAKMAGVTGPATILKADWAPTSPLWALFNGRVARALAARVEPDDFILLSQGWTEGPIIDSFPNHHRVEFAAGYTGVANNAARVFPSHSWLNCVYGQWYGATGVRGRFWDRVIPHYFDPLELPLNESKEPFFLFVGRRNEDKGVQVAIDTAKAHDVPLVVAGQGTYPIPSWVDDRGLIGPEERADLMGRASAVFAPSLYLEPFGKVAVEAMMCGTPAITTDWGAYPETVDNGVTGWRCNTMPEFVSAGDRALRGVLRPVDVYSHAATRFSMDIIRHEYDRYFGDLLVPAWPGA